MARPVTDGHGDKSNVNPTGSVIYEQVCQPIPPSSGEPISCRVLCDYARSSLRLLIINSDMDWVKLRLANRQIFSKQKYPPLVSNFRMLASLSFTNHFTFCNDNGQLSFHAILLSSHFIIMRLLPPFDVSLISSSQRMMLYMKDCLDALQNPKAFKSFSFK